MDSEYEPDKDKSGNLSNQKLDCSQLRLNKKGKRGEINSMKEE